jgi:large subunit ribosomal protein L18
MKLPRQRRLKNKTDYKLRLALLKSEKARLVVRKTNRYITVQIIESTIAQDKVIVGLSSKDLLEKGWPKEELGGLKNLTAAYLTGFLLAKEAEKKHIKEAIFDIGMNRNVHKSRIYAALKGALDAGLKVNHDPQALPTDEQIHVKEYEALIKKLTK